jgi:heme-degrading monooxygenase HmoA/uncharacterized protein (DUF302 family)
MTTTNPREIAFNGVRLRFDSKKSFDELVSALLADIGEKPLMIDDLPAKFDSWESYKAEVESHVGPSGFILFAVMNHGAWIKKVHIQKKVLRVIIGNPLLAITMLRHDLTAGLFAPVELILIEEDDGQSSLTYVRPSSLMVVEINEPLLAAAKELDEKLQALAAEVTATKATGPIAVLEAAFKIIPGKEIDFLAYQASVVPLAAAQSGFRSAYSGPVRDTTWVYFGARFDSEEQMDEWHGERQHRAIQKSAPNWWTSLYLRKWRAPIAGEILGDRLMSETSILVDTALHDTQIQLVRQALAELSAAGAQPFETLTRKFEAYPYQFSGPLLVAPATAKVPYLLTTHWSSADHFNSWISSSSYSALQSLGDVSSELFVPIVETRPREHLRYDKLQRDWEWPIEDRREPLPVLPLGQSFPGVPVG